MISIIVPALNEEQTLQVLYDRVISSSKIWKDSWELIIVDDGSSDRTSEILVKLHEKDDRVRFISFSRNFGHQIAVTAGLQYAAGDAIIVMDADLQDPPEQIERLLTKWREGFHVVYAVRTKRKEIWFKRLAYFCFYRLIAWISTTKIPLDSGDFCLMDRVVVDCLNKMPERNRFVRGLRAWVGYSQIGIPIERNARFAGEVKYTFRKLLKLAFDGLINFSYRPLQTFTTFGTIVAGFSFLGILWNLIVYFFQIEINGLKVKDLPGYTSIILIVLFLGGVQLIGIGVLGEYIGRIFDEVKQRPQYIVKKEMGFNRQTDLG